MKKITKEKVGLAVYGDDLYSDVINFTVASVKTGRHKCFIFNATSVIEDAAMMSSEKISHPQLNDQFAADLTHFTITKKTEKKTHVLLILTGSLETIKKYYRIEEGYIFDWNKFTPPIK